MAHPLALLGPTTLLGPQAALKGFFLPRESLLVARLVLIVTVGLHPYQLLRPPNVSALVQRGPFRSKTASSGAPDVPGQPQQRVSKQHSCRPVGITQLALFGGRGDAQYWPLLYYCKISFSTKISLIRTRLPFLWNIFVRFFCKNTFYLIWTCGHLALWGMCPGRANDGAMFIFRQNTRPSCQPLCTPHCKDT